MPGVRASGAVRVAAAISLALSLAACGKKGDLRLPNDVPQGRAPTPHARVREGRVILDFRVPSPRIFPEREEPWVLVRILRTAASSAEAVEVGALFEKEGFAFDAPLTWSDQALPANSAFSYRLEFRDAARRRRALTEPLPVAWDRLPEAPSGLTAGGGEGAIILTWEKPQGVSEELRYRVYRRISSIAAFASIRPSPITENRFVDSRVDAGNAYCYIVRALFLVRGLEVEGPASAEVCAHPAVYAPPSPRPPGTGTDPGAITP